MSEVAKREELRQMVGRMYEESLAAMFWRGIGRMFAWLPGARKLEMPLPVSLFIVITLGILVCSAIARLIGAMEFFSLVNQAYVLSSAIWAWLSINIAEWQIRQSIQTIQENLPDLLELPEGDNALVKWVGFVASRRNQAIAAVFLFVMMSALSALSAGFDYSQPTAWILAVHLCLGVGWCVFHISWMGALILFYGFYLGHLSLRLFQDHPASTLPLLALHRSAGQLMLFSVLIGALLIPVGLITKMLNSLMLALSVVTLWIPLLAFYTEHGHKLRI
jgi:hypothetical protein